MNWLCYKTLKTAFGTKFQCLLQDFYKNKAWFLVMETTCISLKPKDRDVHLSPPRLIQKSREQVLRIGQGRKYKI